MYKLKHSQLLTRLPLERATAGVQIAGEHLLAAGPLVLALHPAPAAGAGAAALPPADARAHDVAHRGGHETETGGKSEQQRAA